jgi:protein-disulfide isomerase
MSKRAQIQERRKKQRQRQMMITGLAVVGAVLILAALIIWQNVAPVTDIVIPEPINHPFASGTHMGDPNAPVVIEEYSDYLCSFCKRFVDETEPSIIQDYIAEGLVYFVYHNFPLGPESIGPAEASLCAADQGMFWEYHDILFANQLGHDARAYSDRRLVAYADAIGLDLEQFEACAADNDFRDQLEQDQLAATNLGVTSTPTFFINGKMVEGAQPYSVFQAEIEAALAFIGGS